MSYACKLDPYGGQGETVGTLSRRMLDEARDLQMSIDALVLSVDPAERRRLADIIVASAATLSSLERERAAAIESLF